MPPCLQVDVLVSEPMGTLLVNERMLESYIYARDHFLKPGGKMFPVGASCLLACLPLPPSLPSLRLLCSCLLACLLPSSLFPPLPPSGTSAAHMLCSCLALPASSILWPPLASLLLYPAYSCK